MGIEFGDGFGAGGFGELGVVFEVLEAAEGSRRSKFSLAKVSRYKMAERMGCFSKRPVSTAGFRCPAWSAGPGCTSPRPDTKRRGTRP